MEEYISKSALVAEIEKLIERAKAERVLHPKTILAAKNYLLIEDYKKLLSFIDSLEVKEVDLENEIKSWRSNHFHGRRDKEASGEYLERISQLELAKHFFGLGMRQSKNYNNNEE